MDSGSPALICPDLDDGAKLTVNMGNFAAKYLQGVGDEEKGEMKQVCSDCGHAETVRIDCDPDRN